jgi:hypothetical protein
LLLIPLVLLRETASKSRFLQVSQLQKSMGWEINVKKFARCSVVVFGDRNCVFAKGLRGGTPGPQCAFDCDRNSRLVVRPGEERCCAIYGAEVRT